MTFLLSLSWNDLPGIMQLEPLSDLSYVEVRPMENPKSVADKKEALALMSSSTSNSTQDDAIEKMAPGSQKTTAEDAKPKPGKKTAKLLRKLEREKTKGPNWFGMQAPEVTEEQKRDLEILKMRGALDPKRFYKKNDSDALPKYFQVGRVVDSAADRYVDRVPAKMRKSTLVEELMADAEFQRYNKRKYAEIMEERSKKQRRYHGAGGQKGKRAKKK